LSESSPTDDQHQKLLKRAEEVAQTGSWEWDTRTDRLLWSENLYRIFGLEPGEITPSPDYVTEHTHPDDRSGVEARLEEARQRGRLSPLEYRIIRPDGAVRHVRALQAVVEEGDQGQTLVGAVQDVTDWRRAERQIAAHLAVAESLSQWELSGQGFAALLASLCQALDCTGAVVWVPRDDVLVPRTTWRSGTEGAPLLPAAIDEARVPKGRGLPGTVWKTQRPGVRAKGPSGAKDGPPGVVAFPVLYGQEVLAVVEFYGEAPDLDVSDRLLQSLAGIGYELGQFFSRRRGELSPSPLTPRELEVLRLAARGQTAPQIAAELFLSPSTVSTHLKNVYAKYGVSDRASAVAKALREGLIE
jgi:PAS domain S-box-containing protein